MAEDPSSASPSQRETSNPEQSAAEDLQNIPVLLVEDNETDVFIITEVLARCGLRFHLRVARDGEGALLYLQERERDGNLPVLVLLDLNLPKIRGIEVLRRIRSGSSWSGIPVVVITSSENQSDRRAVQSLGADAYFKKPNCLHDYMELGPIIKRLLPPSRQA